MSEELQPLRHRRSGRQDSPFVRLLKTYWVEIAIVFGLLLTIFLFFEQMNIRGTLLAWLQGADDTVMDIVGRAIDALARFRSGLGLSELIAIPLFFVVLAALLWRVRWRLRRTPSLVSLTCPRCGGRIHRVHRHGVDHLVALVVPVRRYRCWDKECRWHGLRVESVGKQARHAPATE